MKKIKALFRCFFPCISPTTTFALRDDLPTTITKKRLSTSLRDDLPEDTFIIQEYEEKEEDSSTTVAKRRSSFSSSMFMAPRVSTTMVIGTLFGHRTENNSFFCVQYDRLNMKPLLFLKLSFPIKILVKEMESGFFRVALEFQRNSSSDERTSSCSLNMVPVWTTYINGRKAGYAKRRRANANDRQILNTMKSVTVGAGVIPSPVTVDASAIPSSCEGEDNTGGGGEIVYMRAFYARVVSSFDSEAFHLMNPEGGDCPGQEFSIFLLRTG